MEEEGILKTIHAPSIKLIAGKPTKKNEDRKYGWEIRIAKGDNLKGVVKELKAIDDEMKINFGQADEQRGE